MSSQAAGFSRRTLLKAGVATGLSMSATGVANEPSLLRAGRSKAQIAITLDLEMARNFPKWNDTHWDYEKGNLDEAAKRYALRAGALVKKYNGKVHYFCVGRVLEQADVSWLVQLADEGHAIGNHTYDHVYLLAKSREEIQYRFQRAPWLIEGMPVADVIRENIRLTSRALAQRAKIQEQGFRTPGGFATGLAGREDLQRMLLELGFRWVSSKYPPHLNTEPEVAPSASIIQNIVEAQLQAQPHMYPTGLLEIPMSPISDIGAFRNGKWKLEWFLEAIEAAVTWTIENNAVFDFLGHPSCLGIVDPELRSIELICNLVRKAGDKAELVDLTKIANDELAKA
jgi:peptidoglycan/xylan/chitin deacetylase (PgdA/CDA1 family)